MFQHHKNHEYWPVGLPQKKKEKSTQMKKLLITSERVKACDVHPTQPWVLSSLFDGKVTIYDYKSGNQVKSFEVSELPIRSARFIPREKWIVCGGDEMQVYIINYATGQKVKKFEAHQDYIRSICVHPTKSYILTCADDLTIKLWDWSKGYRCVRTFEGHTHFIMELAFSPKDPNKFASASLDCTVKMWNVNSSQASYSLEGHSKGINSLSFYHGKDKPFLLTGSDDKTVKVWDYQTKACIQTLEGHAENVTVVSFHPRLGYIISGSEDNSVNIWNNQTYKLEERLSCGLGRVWAICGSLKNTILAMGFDNGTMVVSLGKEVPYVSMDKKGKVVCTMKNEVRQISIRPKLVEELNDGEKIIIPHKELGVMEITPKYMIHDDKGRHIAVCGQGEYVVYKAVSWTNQSFGKAKEFCWGLNTGEYAILERDRKIKIFKNFKESKSIKPEFATENIFGGELLGVKSSEFIQFYEWNTKTMVQLIEVSPTSVKWSGSGRQCAVSTKDKIYFLVYDKKKVTNVINSGVEIGQDGIDDTFNTTFILDERLKHGQWIGDCFIYVNSDKELKYYLAGNVTTIALLDGTYFLLGFVAKFNRVFLMDKEYNIVSYKLHITVLQYKAHVISGEFDKAEKLFSKLPKDCYNNLALFLDKNGGTDMRCKMKALDITTDSEHQFQLCLELGFLEKCMEIAKRTSSDAKWREIGSICLQKCKYELAEQCMINGDDHPGLLLLYTSLERKDGIIKLAEMSRKAGKNNIAFVCNFILGEVDKCVKILTETGKLPEAAFMCRSYCPSKLEEIFGLWKKQLGKNNKTIADNIAHPVEHMERFPMWEKTVIIEMENRGKSNERVIEKMEIPVTTTETKKEDKTETVNETETEKKEEVKEKVKEEVKEEEKNLDELIEQNDKKPSLTDEEKQKMKDKKKD